MLALFLLGVARCVSADLCPDDAALIAAVRSRDYATVSAMMDQAAEENPDLITLINSERIKRISDVICGDALPGDLPTVTCKFTVHYWRHDAYQMARLIKKDGIWEIDEALGVSRERK